MAGLLLFVLSSLLCGLAGSPTMLNVARGLQGIGGAMMFATSLALIAQEFAPHERGTAFGIWGATTGFAVAVGPLVGGVLTDGLGWEWIFLVNVPIGLITAAITVARVPKSSATRTRASTGRGSKRSAPASSAWCWGSSAANPPGGPPLDPPPTWRRGGPDRGVRGR